MSAIDQMTSTRARLEQELQDRRARHRRQSEIVSQVGVMSPSRLAGGVLELVCGACEGVNDDDAMFCTHCGSKFNVSIRLAGSLERSGSR